MGERSVVYDTNTVVSALGFGGTPQTALLTGFTRVWDMYFSKEILSEIERVMRYDKIPVREDESELFLTVMRDEGVPVEPKVSVDESDDPDDNKFLECAFEANAQYLVSGDSDLLELGKFRGTEVVTPDGFLGQQDEGSRLTNS